MILPIYAVLTRNCTKYLEFSKEPNSLIISGPLDSQSS